MQRKPSIFKRLTRSTSLDDMQLRLWKAYLCSRWCKTLPWMLLTHSEAFLIGSLVFFHLPTFSSGRSSRITKTPKRGTGGDAAADYFCFPYQTSHFCSAIHSIFFFPLVMYFCFSFFGIICKALLEQKRQTSNQRNILNCPYRLIRESVSC